MRNLMFLMFLMDSTPQTPKSPARSIGVWLSKDLVPVFDAHVGTKKAAGARFALDAVVEKLEREGAFKDKPDAQAVEIVRNLPPAAVGLLQDIARILRFADADTVKAKLAELENEPALAGEDAR